MIRPVTCLAVLLAFGSGLYLYQSKHRVKLLDDQIAQTVKSTDALREQTRMLSAEWTLLNDPERLRQLASQFLTLQTVAPGQFTSLADLDSRLPPAGPPVDAADEAVASTQPATAASADSRRTGEDEGTAADASIAAAASSDAPTDAAPRNVAARDAASKDAALKNAASRDAALKDAVSATSPRVAMAVPVDAADRRPPASHPAQVQPRLAAGQPQRRDAESRSGGQRLAEARAMIPPSRAPAPLAMSRGGGSMLGMAHGMGSPPMPLPQPMPVSMPRLSYGGGG